MRSTFVAAACAGVLLAACGGWKAGQAGATSVIGGTSAASEMAMLAAPLSRDRALAVMKTRHDGMGAISDAFKAIHRALGPTPDLATVRANAAKVAELSQQASTWFPAGTGPDVAKTRAKPEIWQNSEDFGSKLRAFQTAARALQLAASGNDAAAIKARFADLGGACKACHDKYRAEEQH